MRNLKKMVERDFNEFEELETNSEPATSQIAYQIDPFLFLERAQKDFQKNDFQSAKTEFSMVIEELASKKNRSLEEDKTLKNAYFGRGFSIVKMPPINLLEASTQNQVQFIQEQSLKDLEMAKSDFSQISPFVTKGVKEYLEGLLQLKAGNKTEAEKRFNAAIEKESQFSADCNSELGQLELNNNKIGTAIYYFNEAIRLNSSKSEYYKHRAFAHFYNKEWVNALADCIAVQKLGGEPVFGPLNWCFNALKGQFLKGLAAQDNGSQKILVECLNNPLINEIFWKEMGQLTRKQMFTIIEIIPTGPDKDRLLKACLEQQSALGNMYWNSGSPNKDEIFLLIKAMHNPEEQKFYYSKALDHNPKVSENQQDRLYRLCNAERNIKGKGTTHSMWQQRSELCQRKVSEEQSNDSEEDSWEMPSFQG